MCSGRHVNMSSRPVVAKAPDAAASQQSAEPQAPLDFSHHFSRTTKAREASNLKRFYKYFMIPGIGNLAGGMFPQFIIEGPPGC
jgi:hypothetical protein